ncbi:hypothetical protein, variant [Aphanomyces invadans]|uniref:RRM domain-containing protein n=1 Tax=Aphanomyces invadans TaxID=157072 RepID=A0A024TVC5_9STRA|nr:hypothetical protein H310_08874 [Aphanomyces invadans]XP_008873006.1 hypothetical protein, variant [Aphanomyces invadans]ETV98130.1 hypothetical protein H310_08874 [Aphanomyces invadans]ETV98131.1 hypothetical protein, variant [Aphanomyces invadans]|eukprot:XP_008873005.1 hypothetical protein H310_08874 [Aphanomyces invadans]
MSDLAHTAPSSDELSLRQQQPHETERLPEEGTRKDVDGQDEGRLDADTDPAAPLDCPNSDLVDETDTTSVGVAATPKSPESCSIAREHPPSTVDDDREEGEIEEDVPYVKPTENCTHSIASNDGGDDAAEDDDCVASGTDEATPVAPVHTTPLQEYEQGYYGISFESTSTQLAKVVIRDPSKSIQQSDDIRSHFEAIGGVESLTWSPDSGSGDVTLSDLTALNAVFALPEHSIGGTTLLVSPMPPPVDPTLVAQWRRSYNGTGVHLSNIVHDMTEDMIKAEMSCFGVITSVRRNVKPMEEAPFGYGFVTYASSGQAAHALAAGSHVIHGTTVKINPMKKDFQRSQGAARGGRFGGRGRGDGRGRGEGRGRGGSEGHVRGGFEGRGGGRGGGRSGGGRGRGDSVRDGSRGRGRGASGRGRGGGRGDYGRGPRYPPQGPPLYNGPAYNAPPPPAYNAPSYPPPHHHEQPHPPHGGYHPPSYSQPPPSFNGPSYPPPPQPSPDHAPRNHHAYGQPFGPPQGSYPAHGAYPPPPYGPPSYQRPPPPAYDSPPSRHYQPESHPPSYGRHHDYPTQPPYAPPPPSFYNAGPYNGNHGYSQSSPRSYGAGQAPSSEYGQGRGYARYPDHPPPRHDPPSYGPVRSQGPAYRSGPYDPPPSYR